MNIYAKSCSVLISRIAYKRYINDISRSSEYLNPRVYFKATNPTPFFMQNTCTKTYSIMHNYGKPEV